MDGYLVTVVEVESNSVRSGSSRTDSNGVVLDNRSAVSTSACTVVDSDVRTTVSPSVSNLECVLSSNTVGCPAGVHRVRGERTSSPCVRCTIRLGNFKSDFSTPTVRFKIDVDRDSGWDSECTTALRSVRVRSNRTQGSGWSRWARCIFHVDTAICIQQGVVGDGTVSCTCFDSSFAVFCGSDDFVVVNGVILDTNQLNRSLRSVEVVAFDCGTLVLTVVHLDTFFRRGTVEPVVPDDKIVNISSATCPNITDFTAIDEFVSFNGEVIRSVLIGVVRV